MPETSLTKKKDNFPGGNAGQAGRWLSAAGPIPSRDPFGIMGIINVTPDSFYDGGKCATPAAVLKRAAFLLEEGADILDLGGESSRPGARPISQAEEAARVLPALKDIRQAFPKAVLSVDTVHARTAVEALMAGAAIVNDVSSFDSDAGMLEILAAFRPAYVLTHNRGFPAGRGKDLTSGDVLEEVKIFFARKLDKLIQAGLPENHIVLDPGIGFGKNTEENLAILSRLEELMVFGRPVLAGISMKSFFGDVPGLAPAERGEGTAVASALLWQKGAFWHRVHNAGQTRKALLLAAALTNRS